MRIGGLLKQSLIDWEGKVCAVVFTKGCNFRCGFCHNPSLVLPELINKEDDIPEEKVFNFLRARKGWLDAVVITGGEPTIHHDLKRFIRRIKNLDYPVKLDSNGSNPLVLEKLISSKLVDYIAMDIKTLPEEKSYSLISGCNTPGLIKKIKQSISILKKADIEYLFRTTAIPGFHNEEILNRLKEHFSYCNYHIQEYRDGDTVESLSST